VLSSHNSNRMHLQLMNIYLNCIIAKYTVLQVSTQESHFQGDLYKMISSFRCVGIALCRVQRAVLNRSYQSIEYADSMCIRIEDIPHRSVWMKKRGTTTVMEDFKIMKFSLFVKSLSGLLSMHIAVLCNIMFKCTCFVYRPPQILCL